MAEAAPHSAPTSPPSSSHSATSSNAARRVSLGRFVTWHLLLVLGTGGGGSRKLLRRPVLGQQRRSHWRTRRPAVVGGLHRHLCVKRGLSADNGLSRRRK